MKKKKTQVDVKKKGIMIGASIVVILGVIYLGVDTYLRFSEKQTVDQEMADRVFVTDLVGSEIMGIEYTTPDGPLEFYKEEESWYYAGDKEFPLDQSRIQSLVFTLERLEAERKLENGDDFASYGLDNPSNRVTIKVKDQEDVVILLGNSTEENQYYALKEGDTEAYLISSSLFDQISYGLDELVSLDVFPSIFGDDIQEISITKAGEVSRYQKKELDENGEGIWYRNDKEEESNRIQDSISLDELADTISGFYMDQAVTYKATQQDFEQYGLTGSDNQIMYHYEVAGEEERLVLNIGNLSEEDMGYYVNIEGSDRIYLMYQDMVEGSLGFTLGETTNEEVSGEEIQETP